MPTLSAARIPASKASTVAAHGKSHGSTVAPAQHKVSRTAQSNSASAEVSQIKELQVENARLLASEQEMQAQHAKCKVVQEEAQRMLALTQQRESDLAMLLESAGHNALTTMPIDWSVPEARDALQTDQEDQLVLDRLVDKVRAERERVKQLLDRQRTLQETLRSMSASGDGMPCSTVQCV
mmetsp:Transcript_22213/g.71772  ORF Transcript_22213/g.71772 Transcript_22213/m.71772 type:complete len:181 (+) Transcript_22213:3206-3748(+)